MNPWSQYTAFCNTWIAIAWHRHKDRGYPGMVLDAGLWRWPR